MKEETMTREEIKAAEREKEKQERVDRKKREIIYKKMIAAQKENLRLEKEAPTDSYISLQHINKIYPNAVQGPRLYSGSAH